MKSSKLIDIFKNGNIVIPIYFLKIYKKLNLSLEEFIFLMYLYNLGNKFVFDPNKFGDALNSELTDVMNYISNLTDKGFIRVEVLKNEKGLMEEVVILDDFYNKLTLFTIDEVNKSQVDVNSNVFELIEKEFGRTLSPMEYEIIKAWLENNTSEELIKEAIKEATFNGVSNLRYIDKILYEWGKAGIKSLKDVEDMRKKRNSQKEKDSDIDLDIVDWNWFDEDE
jgi:DNA replication protein